MQKTNLTLLCQEALTRDVYRMRLTSEETLQLSPGQFVNLSLPSLFLRRPISVCDWDGKVLTLVYRTVGHGTEKMAHLPQGTVIDILAGLGHGFHVEKAGQSPLLVGGGVGIPPLLYLAKNLIAQGTKPEVVLGFRNSQDMFLVQDFQSLGCKVTVTTEDGSAGIQGFVTNALPENASYLYACGPEGMLRALYAQTTCSGEFSLEERMGCGFGACMGCSIQTKTGPQRVCREGPVFQREVLLWD